MSLDHLIANYTFLRRCAKNPYLEYFAASAGTGVVPEGQRLRSHLTYYQIARSIGITYEECVRLFKQLKGAVTY